MRDELEEAHERLATDLEREQAHNEVYKQENAVMERVLVFRDTSISILQKRGGGGNVSEDEAAPTAMTSSSGELLRSESSRRSSLPQPVVQSVYTRLSSDLGAPIRSVSDAYHAVERLTDDQGNLMDTGEYHTTIRGIST